MKPSESLRLVECGSIHGADSLRASLADPQGTLVLEDIDTLAPELQGVLAEAMGRTDIPLPRLIATMRADPRDPAPKTPQCGAFRGLMIIRFLPSSGYGEDAVRQRRTEYQCKSCSGNRVVDFFQRHDSVGGDEDGIGFHPAAVVVYP